jgi:cysteinyl-tRNA synthetase
VGPLLAARERLRSPDLPGAADPEAAKNLEQIKARFLEAMDDDFNAPAAIAVLFELARLANTLLNSSATPASRPTLEAIAALYDELAGQVLGVAPRLAEAAGSAEREAGLIRLLIEMRAEARQRKDFKQSDAIRDRLKALGVTLEDGKDGTTWKIG